MINNQLKSVQDKQVLDAIGSDENAKGMFWSNETGHFIER